MGLGIENFLENEDFDLTKEIVGMYKENSILKNECWMILAGFEKASVLTNSQQSFLKGVLELDFFTLLNTDVTDYDTVKFFFLGEIGSEIEIEIPETKYTSGGTELSVNDRNGGSQ